MFPRSYRPVLKARWRRIESEAKPAAYAAIAAQSSARGSHSSDLDQRAPARAEHLLARLRAVGGEPAGRDAGQLGVAASRRARPPAPAGRRAGRAARSRRREQLARGGRVRGDERRAAGERLERLVRDHPRRPWPTCRRSRARSAARCSSSGSRSYSTQATCSTFGGRVVEQAVELAASRRSGSAARAPAAPRPRIVSSPCSGISLPTKSAVNGVRGRPAGPEHPLLRADEADLDRGGRRASRQEARRAPRCRRRRGRPRGSARRSIARARAPRARRRGSGRGRRRACPRARRAG